MPSRSAVVIGGGLAGLSSALQLAEAGWRVRLLEKRPYLGGRATSYLLPGGEHVDNCQHVTMGCCTNLEDFYRRAGAAKQIRFYPRLYFLDQFGRRGTIESAGLPPPLHLAPSFALFPSLGFADKLAIARAMFHIARHAGEPPDAPGADMLSWLARHGQTDAAVQLFWRVVLVSALNEELQRTDARFGVQVFWKAFLANSHGFEVGIPTVPLAALYDGCRAAIERAGGEVSARAAVRFVEIADDKILWAVLQDGTRVSGDVFVSAVPHDALLEILPEQLTQASSMFAGLRNLEVSPITGVHFWFDRQVMREPFLTLVDRTTQWIFNKTLLSEHSAGDVTAGQHLQLVISASYDLVPRSRQEIIDLCAREMRDALPLAREAQLVNAIVIKEVAATFSPQPGCDRWRPAQRSPVQNLYLAGDWTQTGWPATMEGAVRSGYLAAEAVLSDNDEPRTLLAPDMPSEGISAWLARA